MWVLWYFGTLEGQDLDAGFGKRRLCLRCSATDTLPQTGAADFERITLTAAMIDARGANQRYDVVFTERAWDGHVGMGW
eukprot:CAMPEP_0181178808 /NCGR_PEP_ID=MMETSP1096-20121128/5918_1 /TAXON_ID=156174 ORGANISM="Chrysochromulina ericina, Strain CCMP281" /NCGR_SAMPLE_ID=MMETSP1096 /ASSEMBLY_ACC=CAM_ASM_000453 /LENGTH=78 /DNA_ID=CAMNT_0023267103 /DNA_START=296 /DNA_END=530 /DNA_ORIENTATION=-